MNRERLELLTERYGNLSIAVLGDFCLDRYLEIDPSLAEVSLETGLAVHNVVRVRAQPGGAGTVLNNLVALDIGRIFPIGFAGDDGEGFELVRSLAAMPGVRSDHFVQTPLRRTFTYCKPLLIEPGKPPRELHRFDSKNWTPTPAKIETRIIDALRNLAADLDALVIMDQVDLAGTGVVTPPVLAALAELVERRPELLILADCRRGLAGYPPVTWKMNRAELGKFRGGDAPLDLVQAKCAAIELARQNGREVFVTLAEEGILAAMPNGELHHRAAFPIRGEIDIVGAGDAVTANLAAALAAGASAPESLEFAAAAASVVIHQLGTTGAASIGQIAVQALEARPSGGG